jgi:hypothetical protein
LITLHPHLLILILRMSFLFACFRVGDAQICLLLTWEAANPSTSRPGNLITHNICEIIS